MDIDQYFVDDIVLIYSVDSAYMYKTDINRHWTQEKNQATLVSYMVLSDV